MKSDNKSKVKKFIVTALLLVVIIPLAVFIGLSLKKNNNKDIQYKGDIVSDEFVKETTSLTSKDTSDLTEQTQNMSDSEEEAETVLESDIDPAITYADEMLAGMSLHEKICQMFIVTPEAASGYNVVTYIDEKQKKALSDYPVCGYIFFAQNLNNKEQTYDMLAIVKQYAEEYNDIPFFTCVDEEGGKVSRCAKMLGTTSFSPMYDYREDGEGKAYYNAYVIAEDISELGFNLDFAPVADIWSNTSNSVIGKRAYSDNYEEGARLIASAVKGFNDGGVICCLKHFPGHGDTAGDSHNKAVYLNKSLSELANQEYLPFLSGIDAGAGMVMIGHLYLSDEDITSEEDELPASLNYKVITGELRNKLGYNGVVITDSLSMGAITEYFTSDEAAKLSVLAGADILLMPEDFSLAVTSLEEAVDKKEISERRIDESVRRILISEYNYFQRK